MFSLIKKLFKYFDEINEGLENPILEVSVKQSQMVFCFEETNRITIPDLEILNNLCPLMSISEITTFQDMIFVHFENLSESFLKDADKKNRFAILDLYGFIFSLAKSFCTCPNLEFAISNNYIKIYIDLPNVTVKQTYEMDELLKSDGILELDTQRPYVLYVKDW